MRFSRPNRNLQDTFPPSEVGVYPNATDVGDLVSLVHEYPGREWERCASSQIISGSVVTPTAVLISGAHLNTWIEIIYGDVSHNSATARNLQLQMLTPEANVISLGRWFGMVTAAAAGTPSGAEPFFGPGTIASAVASEVVRPDRPLIVPPNYQLLLAGDTAGVAYAITVNLLLIVHFLSDSPLTI